MRQSLGCPAACGVGALPPFYYLKKSHEINPLDPQTIYGLAFAYKFLDDLENAEKYFKDLLDMPEGLLIKMCGERDSNP